MLNCCSSTTHNKKETTDEPQSQPAQPTTTTENPIIMPGFATTCLHGGWEGDPATTASAVPIYRTAPFKFNSTEHAANLFALKELGMIYTRCAGPNGGNAC